MRSVWLVAAALSLGAGAVGLWWGSRPALDEGQVIAHYAAQYVAQTGGVISDCHGVPGRRADVWLIVLCDGDAGRFAYPVGRDGALVPVEGEEA